ncbi:MAG: glycosyltransferase [Cyanobacteria bacterium]|nr:glycosyltransferase [Cyanobacteriota bacterium]MDW8201655.1 glycosyltransferase [Cyanobacteriota bacterium SKYGB_h_bin112]
MLGVIVVSAAIVAAWFAGEGTIRMIFQQLSIWQQNPPSWLVVPMATTWQLLAPTIGLWVVAIIVMKLSPQPQDWSRTLIVSIILILAVRYVIWRSLATLNTTTPLDGTFSLLLFALEMLVLSTSILQLVLMLRVQHRRHAADVLSQVIVSETFTPSVDVLIPSYDEPAFILRRTIIGCQAMDYAYKTIYLLDDTRRPEIERLARELGCEYITRPDNRHAKAGNLNHALPHITGDLVVVFDADFVPTRNFLTRTVGFFQDPEVGLVQTPQSFYNADPIARNLGLENILTPEEEVFYRQIQPIRDAAGSVICAGTSFVVRRQALDAVGGFVTDSLSEDYFTGIRISALGYRLVYLDEKLSAGLAAENIAAHATQRLRWARGTLQAFFIDSNPLTIRGLTLRQRLAHLEGLLHWFTSISRVGFLLFPLAYSFLGVVPVQATLSELIYYFLPYYVMQLTVFAWLNYGSRSALLSDIYALVLCFPLALTVFQVMLRPFSKGFKVTPKGTSSDRFTFNWDLAMPLIIMFILSAVSLWRNLGICIVDWQMGDYTGHIKGLGLGWLWSAYNVMLLGISLLILLDSPKPSVNEWFGLQRVVRCDILNVNPQSKGLAGQSSATDCHQPGSWSTISTVWGMTTMLSEAGAEIMVTQRLPKLEEHQTVAVALTILEENLTLPGLITCTSWQNGFPVARIWFEPLTLAQQRQLITLLFCRPGQWLSNKTPGEFQSLLLLFRMLFKPKVVFERRPSIRAIAIANV